MYIKLCWSKNKKEKRGEGEAEREREREREGGERKWESERKRVEGRGRSRQVSGGAFRVAYLPYHDKVYVGVALGSTWCDHGKLSWPVRVASGRFASTDRRVIDEISSRVCRQDESDGHEIAVFVILVFALLVVAVIIIIIIIIVQCISSRMIWLITRETPV